MKRNIFTTCTIATILLASCNADNKNAYTVNVPLTSEENGLTAYIIDYDNGTKVDSAIVENGVATFNGDCLESILARIIIDGNRYTTFILEPGNIQINDSTRQASGSVLNDEMEMLFEQTNSLRNKLMAISEDDTTAQLAIINEYNSLMDRTMAENMDNPIGYNLFLQKAYDMSLDSLVVAMERHPNLMKSERLNKLVESMKCKEMTSPGNMFKDFEITYDGKTQKLSDYVGKGQYVLVDFWASWCGPCIRETKTIKEIKNKWEDKGLKILGVAVWDEPENTLQAIETHQLPWEQIINAQQIPTDIYGISGIPCIILFAPDGTILVRDKYGKDLMDAVDNAIGSKK